MPELLVGPFVPVDEDEELVDRCELEQPTVVIGGMALEPNSSHGEAVGDAIAPFARAAADEHDIGAYYDALKRPDELDPRASFQTWKCTSPGCPDQSLHDT